jgi:hypothetical protein
VRHLRIQLLRLLGRPVSASAAWLHAMLRQCYALTNVKKCFPGMQMYVASTLGVPMHKLVCKTKRIGGGFGGKETRR